MPRRIFECKAEEAVVTLLNHIGEDARREGLLETPARVVKAWRELCDGYSVDVKSLFKTFVDGACDEMVVLRDISFNSVCEHHMLPFIGIAHVAYIPDGKVVGLSKLARLVNCYAHRLQIQEQLTQQITKALDENLQPRGSACVIEAQHLCMSCRGVRQQNATMITSSLTGAFKQDQAARAEFMGLIGK